MNKIDALKAVLGELHDHKIVICNGMIGREVYSLGDKPNHFYMIGSMGIAPSIALGLAYCAPKRKIAVIEGDGNTLMGLGNLAQVGSVLPNNLIHICLDNGAHASTGGQKTISSAVQLENVARAAGYKNAARATDAASLKQCMVEALKTPGPNFVLGVVEPGTIPGVPRVEIEPPQITARFKQSVTEA